MSTETTPRDKLEARTSVWGWISYCIRKIPGGGGVVRRAIIEDRQAKYSRKHDPVTLHEGDLVYIRQHKLSDASKGVAKKLYPLYRGPGQAMVDNLRKNTYRIKNLVDDTYS